MSLSKFEIDHVPKTARRNFLVSTKAQEVLEREQLRLRDSYRKSSEHMMKQEKELMRGGRKNNFMPRVE
eukprot:CAMPEP_0168618176 /NCGR_PEP_ID=MMETSP0449_2-20121227/5935_1 /TAXON_ID=1082188 /ORGANISM="Strombidium rassoulzadegani, Strain ras09" /LENGTH=68 /DNA_ID=CAMNT_0008659039 /DNA_START=116 /DNA_END=322 /DNA_ORIENTATION=-